jgi:hypothetical protein
MAYLPCARRAHDEDAEFRHCEVVDKYVCCGYQRRRGVRLPCMDAIIEFCSLPRPEG